MTNDSPRRYPPSPGPAEVTQRGRTHAPPTARGPLVRAAVIAAATSATAGGLARGAAHQSAGLASDGAIEAAVASAALAIGACAAAVLAVGSLLLLLGHATRALGHAGRSLDTLAGRCTPVALRRVVALGLGAGLGLLGPAGLAGADEPDLGWAVTSVATATPPAASASVPTEAPAPAEVEVPEPAATPTAAAPAVEAAAPAAGAAPAEAAAESAGDRGVAPAVEPSSTATVRVRPGDSLWSITASHLGRASTAQIAAEWPRWYAANREVIGADPGLIHPGQVLVAPAESGARA